MPSILSAALQGFMLGAGLIVAIGAQNAFVLRQGLLRRHVLPVAFLCAASDALLIALGTAGLGSLIAGRPGLLRLVGLGGAAFLFWYGIVALRRATRPHRLQTAGPTENRLAAAVATCLALTFLNPHVYLDTVVLLGSISARFTGAGRTAFAAGAMTASFAWFFSLGYGARLLTPLFARPLAWWILDALIALTMAVLALLLLRDMVVI